MKKHSARVAPLSACNSPVLTLTKVEGYESTCYKKLGPIRYKSSNMDDLVIAVIWDRFPQMRVTLIVIEPKVLFSTLL
ncbi:hypothetical protein DUI87_10272 [Hirundo rustica rustica]|uniref:Uncharacterized protein n=1 Tax=Hirundo rustica rustica TaxID=333673 RepID=A0A3M0L019_HIRRU|nr:hypothetical protein DUI87_10272 [Hirundo rustica rustica]